MPGQKNHFSRGLRCERCGAARTNHSRRYCRDCYGPARARLPAGRDFHAVNGGGVISPWQTLPDGDRVRVLSNPAD